MTLPDFLLQRRAEAVPAKRLHRKKATGALDLRKDPVVVAARAYKAMDHALRARILAARSQTPPVSVRKIAAAEDLSVARIYALLREMAASGYQPPEDADGP